MSSHALWMIVSGATGFSCFVVIHFTKLLKTPLYAAVLQLSANTFVFISWGSACLDAKGFAQLFAFGGTVVPIIMASITIRKLLRKRRQA